MQQKPERVEVWGTMVRCCVIDEVRRDRLCKLVQRQRECWSEIERIGRNGGEQRFLGTEEADHHRGIDSRRHAPLRPASSPLKVYAAVYADRTKMIFL
jgi:hypothetical protein